MAFEKIDWTPVNTEQFKGDMKARFDAYLKAKEATDTKWKEFSALAEPRAAKKAPAGQVPVLTHKRGKLLLGFKAAPKNASKSSEDAISL